MRLWLIFIFALMTGSVHADEPVRLGIFGTVDSIAPLVVAGRRIEAADSTPVISLLGLKQPIEVGDTLAIVVRTGDEVLVAERVLQIYPVVGAVSEVDDDTAKIMGSLVHIPPDQEIKVGQWFAVSGLWSGAKAITSNLHRFEGGVAQLAGSIDPDSDRLGGSAILTTQRPLDGYEGDVWMLSGTPEGEGLRVRLMSKGVFGRNVDLAVWQGYASLPIASQTYLIHGTQIRGTARDAQMPAAGALIARCVHQGRVVDVAPEGLEAAFDALDCAKHTPAD